MLDSLVRVSRRVGWSTDRFATDPRRRGRSSLNCRDAVSRDRKRCTQSRQPPHGPRPAGAALFRPRPDDASIAPGYNTRRPRGRLATFPADSWPPSSRSWLSHPEKVHPSRRSGRPRPTFDGWRTRACARSRRAEFPGTTLRVHPFASMRFHVLLNSLFKVLFNFPSRYLSAIGLVAVFSLGWSLPPALGCIPKQPDSWDERRGTPGRQ